MGPVDSASTSSAPTEPPDLTRNELVPLRRTRWRKMADGRGGPALAKACRARNLRGVLVQSGDKRAADSDVGTGSNYRLAKRDRMRRRVEASFVRRHSVLAI